MANNFKKRETDELLTNCVICKYGIFRERHRGQHLSNPDPQLTGRVHIWHLQPSASK